MNKYTTILKTQAAIYFVYRLSFVLWRVRSLLGFIVTYFLWSSVFSSHQQIFSYTREMMITYVLLLGIIDSLILTTRTSDIAGEIANGDIINYLLKPVSFFGTVITREVVDKMINGIFSVVEIALFILFLHPKIIIQHDPLAYLFFFIALGIGAAISFFISFGLSLVAFWTAETWAPRFIYFILLSMLAGTVFPLDILPRSLYNILLLTPFPYLVFLPAKIYLKGVTPDTLPLLGIGFVWALALYYLLCAVWKKGLREFSFFGR